MFEIHRLRSLDQRRNFISLLRTLLAKRSGYGPVCKRNNNKLVFLDISLILFFFFETDIIYVYPKVAQRKLNKPLTELKLNSIPTAKYIV